MGDTTGIGWTQKTWNPWHGCHKISPGCANCYMFTEKRQYGQDPDVVVRSKTTFTAPLKWREPSLVFTCSWSDWFIEEADAWRGEAYGIIRATPHIYQVLTKRTGRISDATLPPLYESWTDRIWWGVSVEDRRHGLPRIEGLRWSVSSPNRFLSIEPLLEDIGYDLDLSGIAWVIVGGESGHRRRTMPLLALERVIETCRAFGVPCFVKQDSALKSGQQERIPDELFVQEMPLAMQQVFEVHR